MLSEDEYLQRIELLARDVVRAAETVSCESGLQQAINALARRFKGDGHDRPPQQLGGALLIGPGEDYATECAIFGLDERPEGWALWYTWDNQQLPCTMVTTAVETTRALLEEWSHGRDAHPAQLDRAQIAAVCRTWRGPVIHSPSYTDKVGRAGH